MSWNPHSDDNPWEKPRATKGQKSAQERGASPLDDLINQTKDKFQKFSGKGGGTNKSPFFLLGIAISLWLVSGFYTVKEAEQAAILRFGQYVGSVGAGLRYHWPYPFEEVIKRNVAVNNYLRSEDRKGINREEQSDFYMLTGDENLVELANYTIIWRIKDLQQFLFNVRSPETIILATADSVLREVIARTPINLIITEKRASVNEEVTTLLQNLLDQYRAGIHIVEFLMQKADPPEPVLDAFLDVTRADADRERSQHEARGYRDEIIPRARAHAREVTLAAEAYAQQVIAKSQGEAGRFLSILEEYKKAPELTLLRLYTETMEQVLGNANKILVDPTAQAPVHPYVPLPELQAKKGANKQ